MTEKVMLHAASYDLATLIAEANKAEALKTEDGAERRLAAIADTAALNQDVVEGWKSGGAPEGTVLADVTDEAGNSVRAAVFKPKLADEQIPSPPIGDTPPADAGTTTRRR